MSDTIISFNEDAIHTKLKDLVRTSVGEALNAMLDSDATKQLSMLNTMITRKDARASEPIITPFLLFLPVW